MNRMVVGSVGTPSWFKKYINQMKELDEQIHSHLVDEESGIDLWHLGMFVYDSQNPFDPDIKQPFVCNLLNDYPKMKARLSDIIFSGQIGLPQVQAFLNRQNPFDPKIVFSLTPFPVFCFVDFPQAHISHFINTYNAGKDQFITINDFMDKHDPEIPCLIFIDAAHLIARWKYDKTLSNEEVFFKNLINPNRPIIICRAEKFMNDLNEQIFDRLNAICESEIEIVSSILNRRCDREFDIIDSILANFKKALYPF